MAADKKTIKFDYIKSSSFRVIHVDGAYGGIGPGPNVRISLYSERTPIANSITVALDESGRIVEEVERIGRDADVVREVEAHLVMDLPTAFQITDWLQAKLREAIEKGLVEISISGEDNEGDGQ